ncbi:MAG: hypothetical protein ACREFD_13880 [Stellaceae bacterium]
MKAVFMMFLLAATVAVSTSAFANADDRRWIAQCIRDNASENARTSVIRKYCTCMDNKMSNNETRSITQWEKTHPREEAQCSRQAGWK